MRLSFGKFNGARIEDVPRWYLVWLDSQPWFADRFPRLAEAVARRLDALADDEPQTTSLAADTLKTWRRAMLAKWHPDRPGGSHAGFLAVSDAIQSLNEMLTGRGVSA